MDLLTVALKKFVGYFSVRLKTVQLSLLHCHFPYSSFVIDQMDLFTRLINFSAVLLAPLPRDANFTR